MCSIEVSERNTCSSGALTEYQQIKYDCVKEDDIHNMCAVDRWMAKDAYIVSPLYPEIYPKNLLCSCKIQATIPYVPVTLKMQDFELDDRSPCRDYLEVSVDNGEGARLCGKTQSQFKGRLINLEFITKDSGQKGMMLHVTAENAAVIATCSRKDMEVKIDGLSSLMDAAQAKKSKALLTRKTKEPNIFDMCKNGRWLEPEGKLTSPNYPRGYEKDLLCTCSLRTSTPDTVLEVNTVDFQIHRATPCRDYLDVTAGSQSLRLCGSQKRRFENGIIYVTFRSRQYYPKGFLIEFKATKGAVTVLCDGNVGTKSLRPRRPGPPLILGKDRKPSALPENQKEISGCIGSTVKITCREDERISVIGDFFGVSADACTYSLKDKCTVPTPKHQSAVKRNCNGKSTCSFDVEESRKCKSGLTPNYQQIKYECVPDIALRPMCTQSKWMNNMGFLTSPDYPQFYPDNVDCSCVIRAVTTGSDVTLETMEFDIDSSTPCRDFVEISKNGQKTERFCGAAHKTHTAKLVTIRFRTSQHKTKGFMFKYKINMGILSVYCTENLQRPVSSDVPSGVIEPKQAPTPFPEVEPEITEEPTTYKTSLYAEGLEGDAYLKTRLLNYGPIAHAVSACYGNYINFECKVGEIIRIIDDIYGVSADEACHYREGDCVVPTKGGISVVDEFCSGKRICRNIIVTRMFCEQRTTTYQEIAYECVPVPAMLDMSRQFSTILSQGYISSPKFPTLYESNLNITCTLAAEKGHKVELVLAHLSLFENLCNDYLFVQHNGEKTKYCGKGYGYFVAPFIRITFRSDSLDSLNGFLFYFKGINGTKVQIRANYVPPPAPATQPPSPSSLSGTSFDEFTTTPLYDDYGDTFEPSLEWAPTVDDANNIAPWTHPGSFSANNGVDYYNTAATVPEGANGTKTMPSKEGVEYPDYYNPTLYNYQYDYYDTPADSYTDPLNPDSAQTPDPVALNTGFLEAPFQNPGATPSLANIPVGGTGFVALNSETLGSLLKIPSVPQPVADVVNTPASVLTTQPKKATLDTTTASTYSYQFIQSSSNNNKPVETKTLATPAQATFDTTLNSKTTSSNFPNMNSYNPYPSMADNTKNGKTDTEYVYKASPNAQNDTVGDALAAIADYVAGSSNDIGITSHDYVNPMDIQDSARPEADNGEWSWFEPGTEAETAKGATYDTNNNDYDNIFDQIDSGSELSDINRELNAKTGSPDNSNNYGYTIGKTNDVQKAPQPLPSDFDSINVPGLVGVIPHSETDTIDMAENSKSNNNPVTIDQGNYVNKYPFTSIGAPVDHSPKENVPDDLHGVLPEHAKNNNDDFIQSSISIQIASKSEEEKEPVVDFSNYDYAPVPVNEQPSVIQSNTNPPEEKSDQNDVIMNQDYYDYSYNEYDYRSVDESNQNYDPNTNEAFVPIAPTEVTTKGPITLSNDFIELLKKSQNNSPPKTPIPPVTQTSSAAVTLHTDSYTAATLLSTIAICAYRITFS